MTAMEHVTQPAPARRGFSWKRASPLLRDAFEIAWSRRWKLLAAFPLLLLNRIASIVLPGTTKFLIDDVIGRQNFELLPKLAIAAGAASLVEAASSFTLAQLLGIEAQKTITEYRRRIQRHIQRLPVSYFDANKTGTLLSRTMWDAEGIRNLVGTGLVQMAAGTITALGALVILFVLSPRMTAIVAGLIVVAGTIFGLAMKRLRPAFRERNEISGRVMGRLNENYSGIRVVKAFRAERREARIFTEGAHELLRNVVKTMKTTSGMGVVSSLMLGVVAIVILGVGGREVIAGRMTTGDLVSFSLYIGVLVAPVLMVVAIGTQLVEAFAGLERMREILGLSTEVGDDHRKATIRKVDGRIEVRDLSFAYREGVTVLDGINLVAECGTTTALVGPSGGGKSTLVALIASFYRPTSGAVIVDGRDLADIRLDDYRRHVGIVPQDAFLFDGSVIENIAVGNRAVTRDELIRAAKIAHVDEFAETLPERYDTVVGERGVKLSGGQKQRVAIARAIVADPAILILDEATSSLDSESEALIQDAIYRLVEGRTTFVIAHRLSTIRRANQILVVDKGSIVERGSHSSLLAQEGLYRRLYERQYEFETNLFVNPGEEVADFNDAPPSDEEQTETAPSEGPAAGRIKLP
ncbi:MAG: ABC transporter ATP-binding protein [Acidobacteria bacterium]|nr:ABC transporter ATP-binding protein [Acidobacteriota bacterium]